jgi:hypothetical protein
MKYQKPQLLGKNRPTGKFAAGCNKDHGTGMCGMCSRSR